jgi:polysaccharide deacetylase 2 family uncharacterized protein YibQ
VKFLPLPDETLSEGAAKRQKSWNIRRIAVWSYSTVVVVILAALLQVLSTPEPVPFTPESPEETLAIQAILESASGSSVVPIENLETLLPVATVPAWQANAAVWNSTSQYKIAIVIDDLGLDEDMARQLGLFEAPLTLAFLPYAENLPQQTGRLKNSGHELMVHLPMMPKNKNADPGPNALLDSLPPAEFERRVKWSLARFEGFVGINNHMGSALTENPGLMVRIMVHLRKGGYLFLDSLTSPKSVGIRAATATGVPHIARDIFLDNERDIRKIVAQLDATRQIAQARGHAVAIGHPYPETLKALEFWYGGLDKNRFALVPISQLVAAKSQQALTLNQAVKD